MSKVPKEIMRRIDNYESQHRQWYVARIGLLKSEIESASLGYMGVTFPAEIKNRVDLVEFRPGP